MQNVLKTKTDLNEISTSSADPAVDMQLNITQEKLHQLPQQDHFCEKMQAATKCWIAVWHLYFLENDSLIRNITNSTQCFQTTVLQKVPVTQALR